jgi:hypothetical protein
MSTAQRYGTSAMRHLRPGCVLCGRELLRRSSGRRRLYCGDACRQRAYRLRQQAQRSRGAQAPRADPGEVTRLLALLMGVPPKRRGDRGLT